MEGYLHTRFEAQSHVGTTVFVFSNGCASGLRKKERGEVDEEGRGYSHLLSTVRTLSKPFVYLPINYFQVAGTVLGISTGKKRNKADKVPCFYRRYSGKGNTCLTTNYSCDMCYEDKSKGHSAAKGTYGKG